MSVTAACWPKLYYMLCDTSLYSSSSLQGFDTTQGKGAEDDSAKAGAVKVKSTRQARQYMNRRVSLPALCDVMAVQGAQDVYVVVLSVPFRPSCSLGRCAALAQGGFNRPLAVERTGEKALRN